MAFGDMSHDADSDEDYKLEDSEDEIDVEVILIVTVAVLAVVVVIFIIRFLCCQCCKTRSTQSPPAVSSLSDPSGRIHHEAIHHSNLNQGYIEHDPLALNYHYIAAQQSLRVSRRREGGSYALPAERTQSRSGSQDVISARGNDSGFPLSMQGFGSELVHGSLSQNWDASSLDAVNQITSIHCEESVRELFIPTNRSIKKVISGKSVVMIAHVVDHLGDHLILDNMGISLIVPPGAISDGERHVVTLVLDWDLGDNPDMDSHQALVSPVIYCGPHGLKLNKPCILSYRHCAYDPGDIKIMVSETEMTHSKQWTTLCEAREEMGRCVVTQEECQVKLDHFSLLTSVQSRPASSPGSKWLQVAAFTCPLQPDLDYYQVRIYFLNKTPCALEWAILNEAQFGSTKCCPEKVFLFSGNGEDMFLSMVHLSDKWDCIDGCETQRIPFLSIWHGHCPYASMCFKRNSNSSTRAEEINIHLLAYQEGRDNEHERLVIHMTEHRSVNTQETRNRHESDAQVRIIVADSNPIVANPSAIEISRVSHTGGGISVAIASAATKIDLDKVKDSMSGQEIFPEELKQQLMILLDPSAPLGNDWRALASELSLDQVIRFLESIKTSPTLVLLQHMEQKGGCLDRLSKILRDIGRLDASILVEEVIGINRNNIPIAVEDVIGREGHEHADSTEAESGSVTSNIVGHCNSSFLDSETEVKYL